MSFFCQQAIRESWAPPSQNVSKVHPGTMGAYHEFGKYVTSEVDLKPNLNFAGRLLIQQLIFESPARVLGMSYPVMGERLECVRQQVVPGRERLVYADN